MTSRPRPAREDNEVLATWRLFVLLIAETLGGGSLDATSLLVCGTVPARALAP